jgi:hypothetical protein
LRYRKPNCSCAHRCRCQDFQQSGLFHICPSAFIQWMRSIVHMLNLAMPELIPLPLSSYVQLRAVAPTKLIYGAASLLIRGLSC